MVYKHIQTKVYKLVVALYTTSIIIECKLIIKHKIKWFINTPKPKCIFVYQLCASLIKLG